MDEEKRLFAAKLGIDPDNLPLVLDVPVAGKAADLNRPQSYRAAADGSMPTTLIGGRKKALTLAWLRKLSGEAA